MSLQLSVLNFVMRRMVRPFIERAGRPERARQHLEVSTRLFLHGPKVAKEQSELNGVPVVTFKPQETKADGRILYLHGGGYIAGSPNTHQAMLSFLAKRAGVPVIAPDYRLAPEHPFPAAFEDAQAVLAALDHEATVLGGDSAGGGLALAILADALEAGRVPAGLFAFSPWTELAGTGVSLTENSRRDVILPASRFPELAQMVLAGSDPRDPRVSPLYATLDNVPPIHLEVGLSEILRDDTLRLADRLREHGGNVRVETLQHAPHVWQMLVGLLPESKTSLQRTADFVTTCLSSSPRRQSEN